MKGRKSIKEYRESLSENESRILSDLSFKGKTTFSLKDILKYNVNRKEFLYNLTRKNWILRIKKGIYVIAPLEAGELGAKSHTVHSFVIASHLVEPYYISHWSALNYHNLTHQTPPAVYVTSTKPRNRRRILNAEFIFVTVPSRKMFGFIANKVENRDVYISTPEKTVVDCLDHPEHCGGIVEVAKVIYFEIRRLNLKQVIEMAELMGNRTILKRLGYLLDTLKFDEYMGLLDGVQLSQGYSKLDPKLPNTGRISQRWRLRVNAEIDFEKWLG